MDVPHRLLIVQEDPGLHDRLAQLIRDCRMVFFAGLPGTGKSLMIHQLAHLAAAAGRTVHLLQWDTARPVFEASPAGRRYPMRDGVTHNVIRKALGVWVRDALARWDKSCPGSEDLLIGETPLVGGRFAELARRLDDAAEPVLAATSCRFVIPIPSRDVRRFLEAARERRARRPVHAREREDAPPHLLRELWEDLAGVAPRLGIDAVREGSRPLPYDPALYGRIYQRVLSHRHTEILSMEKPLPSESISVYEFAIAAHDVVPAPEEAAGAIEQAERRYPDPDALQQEIDRWYEV
ncbi:MAG TPA: hypothetical protein VGA35_07825 [bacterium]